MLCASWNQLVLDSFNKFLLIKTREQNYLHFMIHTILKGLLRVTWKNVNVCLKGIVSFN